MNLNLNKVAIIRDETCKIFIIYIKLPTSRKGIGHLFRRTGILMTYHHYRIKKGVYKNVVGPEAAYK